MKEYVGPTVDATRAVATDAFASRTKWWDCDDVLRRSA